MIKNKNLEEFTCCLLPDVVARALHALTSLGPFRPRPGDSGEGIQGWVHGTGSGGQCEGACAGCRCEGKRVNLAVSDTAGQERSHALDQISYRD